jgi:hypothetical protein
MDVSTSECSTSSRESPKSLRDISEYSQLCSLCKTINFKAVFALSSAQIGRQGGAITKTRNDFDPGCVLCSFVTSLLAPVNHKSDSSSSTISEPEYHLRALDSLWPLRLRRTEARVKANPSIVVAVVRGRSTRTLQRSQLNEAVSWGLIVPLAQDCSLTKSTIFPFSYSGRLVSNIHANFARIASWIE